MNTIASQIEDPEKELGRQIKSEYGKFSYIQDYRRTDDNQFEVVVGFRIPRTFNDTKSGKIYYKHLDLKNVATVKADLDNKSLRVDGPNTEEVSERIEGKIQGIRKQIEERLVSATAGKLVELPGVQQDFSKVKKLLRRFKESGKTDLKQFRESESHAQRYIDLLQSMNYIEVSEGVYEESDELKDLRQREEENTFKTVIEDIITNRLEHVKQFDLNNVLPYIKILDAYYFAVYQANDDLKVSIPQLRNLYTRQYGNRKSEYYLENKIQDLIDIGLIEEEDRYFRGNSDISNQIVSGLQA